MVVSQMIQSQFDENYHKVLTHDGSFKVAKTEIKQPILHINKNKKGKFLDVLVQGKKGSYVAKIHKNIRDMMEFVDEGDCAYVKWRNGKPWFVGFQKRKAYDNEKLQNEFLLENGDCDWQSFLEGVDVE